MHWHTAFSQVSSIKALKNGHLLPASPIRGLNELRQFLDFIHIKFCLLKPYEELDDYPLVEPRDLLPSFEPTLTEHARLPGFSMVAFNRPLDYFNEVFQFDLLHICRDPDCRIMGENCVLESSLHKNNLESFLRRLPQRMRDAFKETTSDRHISDISSYSQLIPYLSHMDRAHVLSLDTDKQFYLSGIYASLPSDLDTELKRFGLKARKFKPNDNLLYEKNRELMYQFLMELYGYPISSERKTSAAIFARRLHKMGEQFLIKALGQSDRTITSLFSTQTGRPYPQVEKIALLRLEARGMDVIDVLDQGGFFVDRDRRVVILRVVYTQHDFDPNNVRQDRALSLLRQEIIHPLTGEVCTSFNLLKDTYFLSLRLNDVVRGEALGRIVFKGKEVVEDTDTHEKRLKALHAGLTKQQRRLIGYSDEFYNDIVRVTEGYLYDPNLREDFAELHDLWLEVCGLLSYIKQARKIHQIENLKDRVFKGKKISYLEMLSESVALMAELKFEAAQFFGALIDKALFFSEAILNDRYLIRTYIQPKEESLTPNGLLIRKHYRRLISLVDELKAIRKTRPNA